MRVNHGDGGRGGHHRFNRAAAFAQHRQRALAGKMVGRNAMPWVETLLCMKSPHNPESHKVLQKLFQF
jgi:hypothetical protein